jgi:hypothetical protein
MGQVNPGVSGPTIEAIDGYRIVLNGLETLDINASDRLAAIIIAATGLAERSLKVGLVTIDPEAEKPKGPVKTWDCLLDDD